MKFVPCPGLRSSTFSGIGLYENDSSLQALQGEEACALAVAGAAGGIMLSAGLADPYTLCKICQ